MNQVNSEIIRHAWPEGSVWDGEEEEEEDNDEQRRYSERVEKLVLNNANIQHAMLRDVKRNTRGREEKVDEERWLHLMNSTQAFKWN